MMDKNFQGKLKANSPLKPFKDNRLSRTILENNR